MVVCARLVEEGRPTTRLPYSYLFNMSQRIAAIHLWHTLPLKEIILYLD